MVTDMVARTKQELTSQQKKTAKRMRDQEQLHSHAWPKLVLGGLTWAGALTMCWVGSLGRGCFPCVGDHLGGGAYHVLGITWAGVLKMCCGITWAGVLTMCWVGSLGRGYFPCVGWDHLGGGAYHVLGGIKQDIVSSCRGTET